MNLLGEKVLGGEKGPYVDFEVLVEGRTFHMHRLVFFQKFGIGRAEWELWLDERLVGLGAERLTELVRFVYEMGSSGKMDAEMALLRDLRELEYVQWESMRLSVAKKVGKMLLLNVEEEHEGRNAEGWYSVYCDACGKKEDEGILKMLEEYLWNSKVKDLWPVVPNPVQVRPQQALTLVQIQGWRESLSQTALKQHFSARVTYLLDEMSKDQPPEVR